MEEPLPVWTPNPDVDLDQAIEAAFAGILGTVAGAGVGLDAAASRRLQRRSLFTYLTDLITAHTARRPFPALA